MRVEELGPVWISRFAFSASAGKAGRILMHSVPTRVPEGCRQADDRLAEAVAQGVHRLQRPLPAVPAVAVKQELLMVGVPLQRTGMNAK